MSRIGNVLKKGTRMTYVTDIDSMNALPLGKTADQVSFCKKTEHGPSIRKTVQAKLMRVWGYWQNRRQLAKLAVMDDRLLQDIGLIRSDIDQAYLVPFNEDATEFLSNARHAKRVSQTNRWIRKAENT